MGLATRVEVGQGLPVMRRTFSPLSRAGWPGDVSLAHQAFADKEGADAGRPELREVGMACDAAFGDEMDVLRHAAGEIDRGLERRLEGPQIAVVDADEFGVEAESAVEFDLVVYLDKASMRHSAAASRR